MVFGPKSGTYVRLRKNGETVAMRNRRPFDGVRSSKQPRNLSTDMEIIVMQLTGTHLSQSAFGVVGSRFLLEIRHCDWNLELYRRMRGTVGFLTLRRLWRPILLDRRLLLAN
jgi:hypothetical protein